VPTPAKAADVAYKEEDGGSRPSTPTTVAPQGQFGRTSPAIRSTTLGESITERDSRSVRHRAQAALSTQRMVWAVGELSTRARREAESRAILLGFVEDGVAGSRS
jgi:hypothetical protein